MSDTAISIAILVGLVVGLLFFVPMAVWGWKLVRDYLNKYQRQTRDRTFEGTGRDKESGQAGRGGSDPAEE